MNLLELMRKHTQIQFDEEDRVRFSFWYAYLHQGYVYINYFNKKQAAHLHIVKPPIGFTVDHEDRDRLNNRRTNLRIATDSEQQSNKDLTIQNTSGFKGVSWDPINRNWRARIWRQGRTINLGSFPTKELAAEMYNKAARHYQGNFAVLNIIKENI